MPVTLNVPDTRPGGQINVVEIAGTALLTCPDEAAKIAAVIREDAPGLSECVVDFNDAIYLTVNFVATALAPFFTGQSEIALRNTKLTLRYKPANRGTINAGVSRLQKLSKTIQRYS